MTDDTKPEARGGIRISVAASYNWKIEEPFVALSITDDPEEPPRIWAIHPEQAKQIGIALIACGENAIQDAMMLKVLTDGLMMPPDQASAVCQLLRQQATAQSKGQVEKMVHVPWKDGVQ